MILPQNTLLIHGTLADEVRHLSIPFNQVPAAGSEMASGGKAIDTIRGLVNGILLVLRTLAAAQTVSVDVVFDLIFQVLIQNTDTATNLDEIKSLKTGFGAFLGIMKAWGPKLSGLKDGKLLVVECDSPEEYNQFLQRVFQTTAHTRFCVTKNGYVGLVPYRTEIGDLMAVFDGSTHQFILRNASREEDDDTPSYKLVGSGYLQCLDDEGGSSRTIEDQDIKLI